MKKKTLLVSGSLLVMLFAIALIGFLAPAPESAALPSCDCVGQMETPEDWGLGGTCGEATGDLWERLEATAHQQCGIADACGMTVVITAGCHGMEGCKMIDGYMIHGCCDDGLM